MMRQWLYELGWICPTLSGRMLVNSNTFPYTPSCGEWYLVKTGGTNFKSIWLQMSTSLQINLISLKYIIRLLPSPKEIVVSHLVSGPFVCEQVHFFFVHLFLCRRCSPESKTLIKFCRTIRKRRFSSCKRCFCIALTHVCYAASY
jgi:hypothetical protein